MKRSLLLFSLLFLTSGLSAFAADSAAIFKADLIKQVDDMEKKFVGLAEKMPQEKYTWRPGEGVRSVSEVFVHIANANMFIPNAAGVKPPADMDRNAEKTVTSKPEVVAILKKGFAHLRGAANDLNPADLTRAIKVFGRDSTVQGLYLLVISHMHEHLGQAIAYSRVNGVVPPWSGGD